MVIKMISRALHREAKKAEENPPAPTQEVVLLTEIRDLLRK